MLVQVANPSVHPLITTLPYASRLDDWTLPDMFGVLGLHRHVVRLVELDGNSYVVKELPDDLVRREYRLLRELDDAGLPTVEVIAAVTGKPGVDGMLVTRHLDYSIPYRTLLAGRGLTIPYLGDRVIDALVGLLVRLHLAGFFWGDCSLSNTLFRRDAGALSAYVIDMETGERHPQLSDGQRALDINVATTNVIGGLFDLQTGGKLRADIDPMEVVEQISERYDRLWDEVTETRQFTPGDTRQIEQHLQRLHELGFDVEEMDIVDDGEAGSYRYVPRVVEHGFHRERLKNLTGLDASENQAKRLLDDIRSFGIDMQQERRQHSEATGRPVRIAPENVIAVRWLDDRFEPLMELIPVHMFDKLQAAEIYLQLLEHRTLLVRDGDVEVSLEEALKSYIDDVLASAPNEVNITRETSNETDTFDVHE